MKNTEDKTEKTLNSLIGIQRPEVSTNFAGKVWQRIQEKKQPKISGYVMLRAAVLAGILAGINIFTFLHFQHAPAKMNTNINPVAQSYLINDVSLTSIIK